MAVSWLRRAVAVAAVGCLAACGGSGSETPESWPQPVGGELTPEMCDLLTEADLDAAWSAREADPSAGPNAIACRSEGGHQLRLNLQPDPVSAELHLSALVPRQGVTGEPRVDTVPGADQSWYGVLHGVAHELLVRRGALLVGLSFSSGDAGDAHQAITALAAKVLQRIPQVGATATGKPHEMVVTVTGTNVVTAGVEWTDPAAPGERRKEREAELPWTKKISVPWFGDQPRMLGQVLVTRGTAANPRRPSEVTCRVTVDGEEIVAARDALVANCEITYRDRP